MKKTEEAIEAYGTNIEIIRSKRRTISVEVREDARVIVRAPIRMKDKDMQKFIHDKSPWIEKHLQAIKKRQRSRQALGLPLKPMPLTEDEIKKLKDQAIKDFGTRVKKYEAIMDVETSRISIRHQKTRWGSCSRKGNLNFNCVLMLCPEDVRDYVVVHELAHLKEMNHSPKFWAVVEDVLPGYKTQRKWLKEKGGEIICR